MNKEQIAKAEQRKLDTANKKAFITSAFQTVLSAVAKHTATVTKGPKMQVTFSNNNRYVRFNAYGKSAAILIYRDGNIEVQLTEAFHSPHNEQLFEFTLDEAVQKEFLKSFKKTLSWLLPQVFEVGPADFHTFMDYVSGSQTIEEAHEKVARDWKPVTPRRKS